MDDIVNLGEILKTIGAVVGLIVGLTTLSTFIRRRERVRVDSSTVFQEHSGTIEITVTNLGGSDLTLTEVGFSVVKPLHMAGILRMLLFPIYAWNIRKRCRNGRRYSDLGEEDGVQLVIPLKPSQPIIRKIAMGYIAGWLSPGEVAWPYAKDSAGRETYSIRPADVYVWEDNAWKTV